jgi:pyruvate,water dikinase
MSSCLPLSQLRNSDVAVVGGKNASLGELLAVLDPLGVRIPDGFAVTAQAWRDFLAYNGLAARLAAELATLDTQRLDNLATVGANCRALVAAGRIPADIGDEIRQAYRNLKGKADMSVAVRSSATAEDLPTASFAGQHDSFLNVSGGD